jgi:hypothetical protein
MPKYIAKIYQNYGLQGPSEEFIGNEGLAKEFTITTKAPTGWQPGSARKEEILANARLSFDLLKVDKVFYFFFFCHCLSRAPKKT